MSRFCLYIVDQEEEDPAALIARANKMQKKKKKMEGTIKRKTSRKTTSGPLSVIIMVYLI